LSHSMENSCERLWQSRSANHHYHHHHHHHHHQTPHYSDNQPFGHGQGKRGARSMLRWSVWAACTRITASMLCFSFRIATAKNPPNETMLAAAPPIRAGSAFGPAGRAASTVTNSVCSNSASTGGCCAVARRGTSTEPKSRAAQATERSAFLASVLGDRRGELSCEEPLRSAIWSRGHRAGGRVSIIQGGEGKGHHLNNATHRNPPGNLGGGRREGGGASFPNSGVAL
jgi:hypothetical protein